MTNSLQSGWSNLLQTVQGTTCSLILFLLLAPPAFAIIDINNNGLSDLWEKAHNDNQLYPANYDLQADPDQDGWTNEQEAAAGTDPADPNPPGGFIRPDITHVPAIYGEENGQPVVLTPEAVTVTWPAIAGKRYTLLFSLDLTAEGWLPVGDPFNGGGGEVTYGFPVQETPVRFWRVAVTDVDTDNDGLTNAEEAQLGTDPNNPDTDGDGRTDKEEIGDGTEPTEPDTDEDGLNDSEDAEPNDAEINWKKTPEARYVWIEQMTTPNVYAYPYFSDNYYYHETTVAPVAVNSSGKILFPQYTEGIFEAYSTADTRTNALWDSATRQWIPLAPSGAQTIQVGDVTLNTTDHALVFWDINDAGTVSGLGGGILTSSPVDQWHIEYSQPGMIWKTSTGNSLVYQSPSYYFVHAAHPANTVCMSEFGTSRSIGNPGGGIGIDGSVNLIAEFNTVGPDPDACNWMIYNGPVAPDLLGQPVRQTPNADNYSAYYHYSFAGAIHDNNRALFVQHPRGAEEANLWFKDGSAVEIISTIDDSIDYNDTGITLAPTKKDNNSERLWIAAHSKVLLEKRVGSTGAGRWHQPPSMAEGAIRLIARGEAITRGKPADGTAAAIPPKLWRNGEYHDLNDEDVTSKPSGVTITEAIDLASNGIILVQAEEGGVKKTGILVPVEAKEVGFGGSNYHELKSDDATVTYDSPHWVDNNGDGDATDVAQSECNHAVGFTRNTKPKIGVKLKVANASNLGPIKVKAIAPSGMEIPETAATVSGDEVTLPLTEASSTLVNTIKFYDKNDDAKAFGVEWHLKIGTAAWAKVATTKHTVYLTIENPLTGLRQETLFEIGCRRADGESTASQARTKAYAEFQARRVVRLSDGMTLTYWKLNQLGRTDTAGLLGAGDGNGNCNAWASFFRDVLRVQGIEANMVQVVPNITDANPLERRLAVKDWTFTGDGAALGPFPYRINVDAHAGTGETHAQNNQNPPKLFNTHFLTISDLTVYDASYGTQPVNTSVKDYEDATFAGFGKLIEQIDGTKKVGLRKNDVSGNSVAEVSILDVEGE